MDVAIVILFSIFILCSILNIIFLIIYKQNIKTNWGFIVFCTLFSLVLGLTYFDIKMRLKDDLTDFRTVITLMTVIIAAASFVTTVYLSNKTSKVNQENQKSNFLMGLMKNHYDLMNDKKADIDSLLKSLKHEFKENNYSFNKLIKAFDNEFRGRTVDLEKELEKAKTYFSTSDLKNLDKGKINTAFKMFEKINETREDDVSRILISYFKMKGSYPDFYNSLNESEKNKAIYETLAKYLNDNTDFFKIVDTFVLKHKNILDNKLTFEEIGNICNKIFDDEYAAVGHFFRSSYRVVKLINLYYKDNLELRKSYLGILRSQYSENIILAIYYNCVFTDKGIGYANQLVRSDFFGDSKDLVDDNPIHFRTEELIFGEKDLRTIKKVFTAESTFYKSDKRLEELKGYILRSFSNS